MVYGSVSRGFKSGGFNLTAASSDPPFNPEYLTAYEAGVKSTLFDQRLRLNASGFYYDYTNIQVTALNGALESVYNAAAGKVYGADIDFEAILTDQFTLSGGVEALHSEYTKFNNAVTYSLVDATNPGLGYASGISSATGKTLLQAPTLTIGIQGDYKIPTEYGSFDIVGAYSHNSGYFVTPDNSLKQPAYNSVSASMKFTSRSGRYWVRAWGKNLTNELTTGLLSYSGAAGGALYPAGMPNAPRTYGVTIGVKY
jgi:iron complex outermembrane receptor protein